MNYWLMKSEPDVYGIADLARDQQTLWDGVRNYQARNFLREMQPGDQVFFYHSNTEPPGIAGLMQVAESGVIDPTQFDPDSKYFDPKSQLEQPRWQTVTVQFVQVFPTLISLEQLRQMFTPEQLWVVRQGNRLSVLPVERAIAEKIIEMANSSP
ncbi:MAG: EVE domain-containing protein [Oscillatoriophycideae cyanobacterium NC_groundwater_1537_Pr4_S-0.65um_50_18]|nr:EVE domain-containing protein [Oscillatoriophycideae cyanobacterium NC_groundwater_1537_Pr4_S-0.65um_50_18]